MGISLFVSGVIVALTTLWLGDSRVFFRKNLLILILIIFFIIVCLFISETNYVNLFLYYELFLLLSFFLVYTLSPNRRSIPVAIYFLTWTQFGSLLVLVAILGLLSEQNSLFLLPSYKLTSHFIKLCFFIGFGIKIPMWPFYYWLTKTHVEASSFFSIYLSGFLVKTAVYLFNFFFSFYFNTLYLNWLFIIIVVGVVDSSIKMWHQYDLKKLVAYTTVQEMNLLIIPIIWNNEYSEFLVSFFIVTHCLLSSLFFFIIDVLSKRFNTRVTTKINGLIHITPNLAYSIFFSIILFTGLPYTAKFFIEVMIFNHLLSYDVVLTVFVVVIANVVGIIGFCKNFFNVLFGKPIIFKTVSDLSKRELYLFIYIFVSLFGLIFMTFFF